MNKKLGIAAGAALLAACLGHQAMAATMTFNGLTTTAITPTNYTENGLTIMATSPSIDPNPAGFAHFDVYANAVGGTVADNVGAVHTGNAGEQVRFTFSGGAFDLLSIDITGWHAAPNDPTGGTPAVFTSSSTATFNVASLTTGVIDFSSMSGWSNILFFTLTMPLSSFACGAGGQDNCSIIGFDDVTFQAASEVPLPAAFPLLLAGLGALGLMARRKNQRNTA